CNMMFVIQLDSPALGQPRQALRGAAAFDPSLGKIFIAVDSDIDPDSMDGVLWALSYSMQPHRDVEIVRGKVPRLDPSVTPSADEQGASAMLINACREHPYLPVSLPRRDDMTTEASIALAASTTSWRSSLTAQHWRVLWGSYLGWIFDGYEAFALIVALPPALHSLLRPDQAPDAAIYAGLAIGITLLGW